MAVIANRYWRVGWLCRKLSQAPRLEAGRVAGTKLATLAYGPGLELKEIAS
jgi:hypothetical protein